MQTLVKQRLANALLVATTLLGWAIVYAALNRAHAKWDGEHLDQVQADWFAAQHNKQGQWCCDKADGHWYDSNYTLNNDGSVTLADGHKIAPHMVLDNPNPTGRAVYWHSDRGTDYCFAPGTLS